ncbi:MAG: hypothetical protein QW037_02605 [Thermoplasmata archaeon]
MVIAVVPVGISRRLSGKHFLEFCNKRIIDVVVENLNESNLFSKVIIYTINNFDIKNAEIIIDKWRTGVLPILIDALERFNENVFLLGGDMPLANSKSFFPLLLYPESLSVIPKWENGYLEPLHALYSKSALNFQKNKNSMHEFIEHIPKVFIKAEKIGKMAFFNINTNDDYIELKKLCYGNF